MNSLIKTHLLVCSNALFLAAVFAFSAWYVNRTEISVKNVVTQNIQEQKETLSNLLEITDRNGADPLTENIIQDCKRRSEFELYLDKLGSLSRKDLITTQQLFESCGDFYAMRKALMVSRLEREYEILKDNVTLQSLFSHADTFGDMTSRFGKLIELEKNRSSLLSDQTNIQAEIISLLFDGGTSAHSRLASLLKEAQEISQLLNVLGTQIDELRVLTI